MENELTEKRLHTEEIFYGTVLHVQRDTISLPNEKNGIREVIRHVGAVCIAPLTSDGKLVVERQFRYPIEQVITEIPAGKLNYAGEDRLSAAQRELKEETGYTAERWTDMGLYYPAPAYSDEKITMYLAEGLHPGERHLDEDEFLEVEEIPLEELVSQVADGTITDGKTQVAVLKVAELLRRRAEGEVSRSADPSLSGPAASDTPAFSESLPEEEPASFNIISVEEETAEPGTSDQSPAEPAEDQGFTAKARRRISIDKAKKIFTRSLIAGIIIMVVGGALNIPIIALPGLLLLIFGVAVDLICCRCPHCGKYLNKRSSARECPYCGQYLRPDGSKG